MPKWLDKKDEKYWEKAKGIVSYTKRKPEAKFNDDDWALVTHIMNNMGPVKRRKKKKKTAFLKEAVSVVIAPFEPMIQKAVEAIEKIEPGYFSAIKNIVVEQSTEAGDPFHFGKVKSDKSDTIYISMSAVRSALSGSSDESQIINAIASILAHEMGHLKAKLEGGEGPAESEERRILDKLLSQSTDYINSLVVLANELDIAGDYQTANFIDNKLSTLTGISKTAVVSNYVNPDDVADTIFRIIYHFAQKVRPESQHNYLLNFAEKLRSMDQIALSTKKKNPGAGLGASISIIKNLLAGHNSIEIDRIINRVVSGISSI